MTTFQLAQKNGTMLIANIGIVSNEVWQVFTSKNAREIYAFVVYLVRLFALFAVCCGYQARAWYEGSRQTNQEQVDIVAEPVAVQPVIEPAPVTPQKYNTKQLRKMCQEKKIQYRFRKGKKSHYLTVDEMKEKLGLV